MSISSDFLFSFVMRYVWDFQQTYIATNACETGFRSQRSI